MSSDTRPATAKEWAAHDRQRRRMAVRNRAWAEMVKTLPDLPRIYRTATGEARPMSDGAGGAG